MMPVEISNSGQLSALEEIGSKLADIDLIARSCSPGLYEKFDFSGNYRAFAACDLDPGSARRIYHDVFGWTNAVWRFLAGANVSELESSQDWISYLQAFQGVSLGIAAALGKIADYQSINFETDDSIKIFGHRKSVKLSGCERSDGDLLSNLSDAPRIINQKLVVSDIPGANGITLGLQKYLGDMVAQVGFDAAVAPVDIPSAVKKLKDSLALVALDYDNEALVRDYISAIVLLENPDQDEHQSLSIEATPSVVYIGKNCELAIFAEALVHEADHQLLYEIRRAHPLTDESSTIRFCSPWRMDPRPAGGLVFGASAFYRVSTFWQSLLTSRYHVPDPLAAKYRAILTATQALSSLNTLSDCNVLTKFGKNFCEHLKMETKEQIRKLSKIPEFSVLNDKAKRAVAEHIDEWEATNNCVASVQVLQGG